MTRKAYPSDVSEAEWQAIEPLLPPHKRHRPPSDSRSPEIVNGIFYVLWGGCSWRGLPHDLPPWQTVYNYFQRWQRLGVWQKIRKQLRHQVRERINKTDYLRRS